MRRAALGLAVALGAALSAPVPRPQQSPVSERLRGVFAASDRVAWASGDKGTVLRTVDGGATWTRLAVPGAETIGGSAGAAPPDPARALDFRDVEAFDTEKAILLSIGPGDASRIYRTIDGGATWTRPFTNTDPKAFYDAIAFWDREHGLAFGDPVDGRFTVIRTSDAGATWTQVPPAGLPPALANEGAFAASGTCLTVQGTRHAWFATGGAARTRVFRSTDQGLTWRAADTPIAGGAASSGIFSLAFHDERHGIAVGGDYRRESEGGANLALTTDGGATWTAPAAGLRAFRSAVAYVPGSKGRRLLAVGPSGTDVSTDGGTTWRAASDAGAHALAISPAGGAAWAVGEGGRILTIVRP